MHRAYLSIIVFLILVLAVVLFTSSKNPMNDNNLEYNNDDETVEGVKDKTLNNELFKKYFSSVEPKRDIYEDWESAAIRLEEVPKEESREYAAGLLLEARKAVNVNGEIGVPTLNNLNNFFNPTDDQLKELLKLNGSIIPTRIKKSYIQLEQANELIENEQMSEEIEFIVKEIRSIEFYNKETLYEFSLAFSKYKNSIEKILVITKNLQ